MLESVKGLWERGWAIHLLKPKSKAPISHGWTSGARSTWAELTFAYVKGMNVGVRLGRASAVDGGYLAVIDCDVKSTDGAHVKELEAKLRELLVPEGLTVLSGRGNGSRHIYVRTRVAAQPQRLAQSSEKVRVLMPSVKKYTPAEEKTFTKKELGEGWRLRAAWEISLMGEGQQVVLPPSIHPDSGRAYAWKDATRDVPWYTPRHAATAGPIKERVALGEFTPVAVDLVGSTLPSYIVDAILSGAGVTDRSASLFTAAKAMARAGFKDGEILSVLTDPDTYLGQAALERRGGNRRSAAEWVATHTLGKAQQAVSAAADFGPLPEGEAELSTEQADEQALELCGETDWRFKLEYQGKSIKNTLRNLLLLLDNETGGDAFYRNEFAVTDHYTRDTPWGGKKDAEVTDCDPTRLKVWLIDRFRFEPSTNVIEEAIKATAIKNQIHPVREHLVSLEWDGVPRIDGWLKRYMNAAGPEPYLTEISRKTLIGMVARVMEPGVRYAQVLIMEGKQGCGKSGALRILGGQWYSDTPIDVTNKDAVVAMRSVWLMELGELSSMKSADTDKLKAFISQRVDRIRLPYGRRAEDFPRQCVFIGTTNKDEYLKDLSGNRRFWPVRVFRCEFKELERDRDQLLAEAVFAWGLGEHFEDLESEESWEQSRQEQDARMFHDPLAGELQKELRNFDAKMHPNFDPNSFTVNDLLGVLGPYSDLTKSMRDILRITKALRAMGYEKHRERIDGLQQNVWKR